MERALEQEDLKEAESIVHTVKGVAGNLGASALAEAASSLDAELKRGSSPIELREAFGIQLERTLQTLRRAFQDQQDKEAQAERNSGGQPQSITGWADTGSTAELSAEQKELLQTLEIFLSSSDGEAVELIETSRSAFIEILGAATYDAVAELVQRFDFPAALAFLQAHRQSER